ncbi:MAG: Holliday junction resolvase RuvX, partial [Brachymonas sp.]|nr:Holliday junction resolvase RuvX [Brachymonas sp.]
MSSIAAFYPPDNIPSPLPVRAQQYLGIDYGKKRVGVAAGNSITHTATPCKTVVAQGDARLEGIAALVREWAPQALVLGIPFHPDGAAHDNTRRALAFGKQLAQRCRLPVYGVDERYSTTEAHAQGAKDADAASACIIL